MPEGLKNTGPTFCRMMKAILKDQMQRNVFAYVDDIVVGSRKKTTQIIDLAETFTNMCIVQLNLNPIALLSLTRIIPMMTSGAAWASSTTTWFM
jgi:capsule polysaccharide export protein KpsC/LpsZ